MSMTLTNPCQRTAGHDMSQFVPGHSLIRVIMTSRPFIL